MSKTSIFYLGVYEFIFNFIIFQIDKTVTFKGKFLVQTENRLIIFSH